MLNCLLCLNTVTKLDSFSLDASIEKTTVKEVIKNHFEFLRPIFTDPNFSKNSQYVCKSCYFKLENFHCLHSNVKSLYNSYEVEEAPQFIKDEMNEYIIEEIDCKLEPEEEDMGETYEVTTQLLEIERLEPENMHFDEFITSDIIMEDIPRTSSRLIRPSKAYKDLYEEGDAKIREYANMECELCSYKFMSMMEAKVHYRTLHNAQGFIRCCGKKFDIRSRLMDHINVHNNKDTFQCHICYKSFASKATLRLHQPLHKDDKPYECFHCPKTFASKSIIRAHLHNIHRFDNIEASYECEMCLKKFKSEHRLKNHYKKVHDPNVQLICEICSKQVKGKESLTAHLRTHDAVRAEDRIQCKLCGNFQKDLKTFKSHMKSHLESQITEHICHICNKKSVSRKALLAHIRYIHIAEKSFKCRFCEKGFKKKINLVDHEATHTGEDLYQCPFCPKTFKSNSNMHKHKKNMHKEEYEAIKPAYLRAVL